MKKLTPKWYVYELVDPRNNEVFYVGKGTGRRMYAHGRPHLRTESHKDRLIKKIGYGNVIRRKFAEFWDEQAAYVCESDRMLDLLSQGVHLTNELIATTLATKHRGFPNNSHRELIDTVRDGGWLLSRNQLIQTTGYDLLPEYMEDIGLVLRDLKRWDAIGKKIPATIKAADGVVIMIDKSDWSLSANRGELTYRCAA